MAHFNQTAAAVGWLENTSKTRIYPTNIEKRGFFIFSQKKVVVCHHRYKFGSGIKPDQKPQKIG